MRYLDVENWARRKHFEMFRAFDYPHFNLTATVDVSALLEAVRRGEDSFTIAAVYLLARAANEIEPFRYRIRGERIVVHDVVHPSFTVLLPDETFSFCTVHFDWDYDVFAARAAERIAWVRRYPVLEDEPGQDDLLFMTAIPWVSFTGLMHPIHMSPADSVPRIAWGRYFRQGGRDHMPVSVQAHHALMDGLHAGRYFQRLQALLDRPPFGP